MGRTPHCAESLPALELEYVNYLNHLCFGAIVRRWRLLLLQTRTISRCGITLADEARFRGGPLCSWEPEPFRPRFLIDLARLIGIRRGGSRECRTKAACLIPLPGIDLHLDGRRRNAALFLPFQFAPYSTINPALEVKVTNN